jgi:hypothetical protein
MLAGVTQTLVAQRRDRREHADRLPVRLTTTPHRAEATSPPPRPITSSSQFAANGAGWALLAVSGVSWLYPFQGAAVRARPRPIRRVSRLEGGDDAPDPLGAHRAELRPARQVRDAIRVGTASTEAILRRFTRNASHPVYQAMLELGRAQKTIFIARYLRDRDLQREIEEGLNLIESWNRVNGVIFFGKSGEFATSRRDQQQLGMLALHILQAALVYVNTLMLQDILAEPEWQGVLTAEDRRGLTALFWAHVRPSGEITLNMTKRLALSAGDTSNIDRESA